MKEKKNLDRLIKSFEEKYESGTTLYMDEEETKQLIHYYEEYSMIDKALEVIEMALETSEFKEENYLLKARLLRKDGRHSEALEVLDLSHSYFPNSIENIVLTIRIMLDLKSTDYAFKLMKIHEQKIKMYSSCEYFLLIAKAHEINRNYEGMYDSIRSAVLHKPNSQRALEKLWMAVELTGNYLHSIKIHKDIIDINPYNFQAWYNLGHAFSCVGEYQKAIDALEYSYLINPKFEMGYLDCAEICIQTKQHEKALAIYLETFDMFGSNCDLLSSIGFCYYKLKDFKSSKSFLLRASKLDPYNDEVYYHLSRCFLEEDSNEKAIKCLHKAIKLEDRREEYYAELAGAYMKQGDYVKADYYFRKATETGPEDFSNWFSHAKFLYELGEYKLAAEVISEAECHTYSDKLICLKVAAYIKLSEIPGAFQLLDELMFENVDVDTELRSIDSSLYENHNIQEILEYIRKI